MALKTFNVIVLCIFLPLANSFMWKIYQLKENMPCLDKKSTCKLPDNCSTWNAYKDQQDSLASCGFKSSTGMELRCCPNQFPEGYVPPTTPKPTPPTPHPSIPTDFEVKHLAPILYSTVYMDGFEYHCTAIILSPTKLLTTSKCVGKKVRQKPSRIAVGVTDPRINYDEELEFAVTRNIKQMNNDLALLELRTAIDFTDKAMANGSIAILCHTDELAGQPKLYAVGFAQNTVTNCGLFQTRLERLSDCRVPELRLPVRGIDITSTHICARAMPESSARSDGCINCLTASSSVLHVERADGSLCVAGIATPTTDECNLTDNPVLYTIFLNSAFKNFLGLPESASN